ncbi:MAG TPA: hypothetical protein VHE34_29005 [Puia sp.]|uniref:hypothetical protein n=1 Tax=Puia sp. TaxID=2045100 RepID=UPI002BCD4CE9|nr:hypothetical protein [Puia sp.]HVU99309.1 hypothetical protein [Puia sp.]
MDLLQQYLEGDTLRVYEEIERMGSVAFERGKFREVRAVLTETMNRVAHNLDVIYRALIDERYCFKENPRHDFEIPLLAPKWGTQFYIYRLEAVVRKFGYVPLSLKAFYKVVGSCNLTWDYDTNDMIPWEGADPLQICPITDLLSEAKQMELDDDPMGLQVSADFYHKDNISGGPPYSVELSETPQVDSRFLDEEHETTFIGCLRIAFDGCGFSRPFAVNDQPDFVRYCKRVRPLLKPI